MDGMKLVVLVLVGMFLGAVLTLLTPTAVADYQGTLEVGVNPQYFTYGGNDRTPGDDIKSASVVTIATEGATVYTDRMVIAKATEFAIWIDVEFEGSIAATPNVEFQCRPTGTGDTWKSFNTAVKEIFTGDRDDVASVTIPPAHEIRLKLVGDSGASTEFTNLMLLKR